MPEIVIHSPKEETKENYINVGEFFERAEKSAEENEKKQKLEVPDYNLSEFFDAREKSVEEVQKQTNTVNQKILTSSQESGELRNEEDLRNTFVEKPELVNEESSFEESDDQKPHILGGFQPCS